MHILQKYFVIYFGRMKLINIFSKLSLFWKSLSRKKFKFILKIWNDFKYISITRIERRAREREKEKEKHDLDYTWLINSKGSDCERHIFQNLGHVPLVFLCPIIYIYCIFIYIIYILYYIFIYIYNIYYI